MEKFKTGLIVLILTMIATMIGNAIQLNEISQLYQKTRLERQALDQRHEAMVQEFAESLKSINLFSCIQTVNPRLSNKETAEFTHLVFQYSAEFGVDPYEVFAKSWVETGFDPTVPGGAGEKGFIQVMPGTFKLYLDKFNYTMEDFEDWRCTLKVGISHYKCLLDKNYGNWMKAEAQYNAGFKHGWEERAKYHVKKVYLAQRTLTKYKAK